MWNVKKKKKKSCPEMCTYWAVSSGLEREIKFKWRSL